MYLAWKVPHLTGEYQEIESPPTPCTVFLHVEWEEIKKFFIKNLRELEKHLLEEEKKLCA